LKWWQKIRNWFKKTFLNQTIESPDMAEESFLEWLGIKKKNRNGALSEVTYFTCLKMMSETVAKLPWKYYQKTANGIAEPELNDVAKLLKYRPNPFMTPTAFWNAVEMNRNHFGNAYVYVRSKFSRKRYGGEYKVLDLWVMPSNCVILRRSREDLVRVQRQVQRAAVCFRNRRSPSLQDFAFP